MQMVTFSSSGLLGIITNPEIFGLATYKKKSGVFTARKNGDTLDKDNAEATQSSTKCVTYNCIKDRGC